MDSADRRRKLRSSHFPGTSSSTCRSSVCSIRRLRRWTLDSSSDGGPLHRFEGHARAPRREERAKRRREPRALQLQCGLSMRRPYSRSELGSKRSRNQKKSRAGSAIADVPDVEPTDNAAERGLRVAVIYRKLSLGSRSQGGERTIERLPSSIRPAGYSAARSTPTSPTPSPPTRAAIPSRR